MASKDNDMKSAVKSLWRECFDESAAFLDFYFEYKYSDEANIAIVEQDELVASMQMLPYSMSFCDEIVDTAYISGACTRADRRNGGVMASLIGRSFGSMYDREVLFASLIPAQRWLFDYYARFGFSAAFDYSICDVEAPVGLPIDDEFEVRLYENLDLAELSSFVQSVEVGHGRVRHSAQDIAAVVASLKIDNQRLYICKTRGRIVGYLVGDLQHAKLTVSAIGSATARARAATLAGVVAHWGAMPTVKIVSPVYDDTTTVNLGMGRVINVERALDLYARHNMALSVEFNVVDEILPQNSGFYKISGGVCAKSAAFVANFASMPVTISIADLSAALLGYRLVHLPPVLHRFAPHHPYMDIMLN